MSDELTSVDVEYDPFADDHKLLQVVPSTEAQREIWTSVQMSEKASCAFNESITLEFDGALDLLALTRSLRYIIQRHDALRTTFTPDGASLCISESSDFVLNEISGDEKTFRSETEKEAETAFNLEKGPLIRFTLIAGEDNKNWLILTAHHIICDGWSLAILVGDLAKAYNASLNGKETAQATAYAYSQYAQKTSERTNSVEQEKYWLELYSNQLTPFDLPVEYERPAFRTFDSSRLDFQLEAGLVNDIKTLAGKQGVSLTAFMLTAFYTCLYKWSSDKDLVVGLPAASQPQYDADSLVGHCVNFLPLRIQLDPEQSFSSLLSAVSNLVLDAYEHQNYTYGSLLKKLTIKRDPSRIPLCPVSFNVDQGIQGSALNFQGLETQFHSNPRAYENFEIFINASDYGERFVIECQYNTKLFSEASIKNRLEEYHQVLSQLVEDPQLKLSSISLLSKQQCSALIQQHSLQQDFSKNLSLAELFDRQAQTTPDVDAVICGEETLSYQALQKRSNKIASLLIEQGIVAGDLVGICLDRSTDLLTVLLGVLKTGAGYVPLDPDYPVERLNFMLQDADLQYLITQGKYSDILHEVRHRFLIEKLLEDCAGHSSENPDVTISADSICYVIYTSGSTGKPKGVMVPHSSVCNFLQSMAEKPGISDRDTLLAVTTLSFDIAVLELYLPLICGAKVVIATREQVVDGNKLKALITQQQVTMMQATPATWRLLCDARWQGNDTFKILCGGEALPADLCTELLARSGQVWNMYGPTEATVWSTCYHLTSDSGTPSIGKAIANTNLYVLDEHSNLVPDGIHGELFIGGDGVTLGYLNRESLNQQRFLHLDIAGNDRVYRTGDKVRFDRDGNLHYAGRLDDQIKLRGFRIELGEIESAIRQHDAISDCAVTVQKLAAGDERLVGFVVTTEPSLDFKQLQDFLTKTLPGYMIPLHFTLLSALPSTPNGKLDRNVLPSFDFAGSASKTFTEARTATERQLILIWKDVLKLPSISISDNFFDLGGHSLLIAKIIQKLEQARSVQLEYRDIFDNPTIEQLSAYIDNLTGQGKQHLIKPILPRQASQANVLSLAQQRLWYLDKMDPGSTHFNLPSAFRFIGTLDIAALERAFQQMIDRHETLRTSIIEKDDSPLQLIHEHIEYNLPVSEIIDTNNQQKLLTEKLDALQKSCFDISSAPLFKAELITLNDTQSVLFFMPHHLIFDGWSFDIFVHEITALYCQNTGNEVTPLEKLDFQYTDYAIWLRALLSSEELEDQLHYWKQQLQGDLPVLQMPLDFSRPEIAENRGAEIHFEIDAALFDRLQTLSRSKDVSIFMLLMAAYLCLLNKYTEQTDLIVGAPMADRTRPGTENLIGFFVNALVLRFHIDPEQPFTDLLQQVKETCLSGFAHQDVPFETLVEQLHPDRDLSRAPLFQTSVTYQDVSAREVSMGDIQIQQVEIPTIEAPLDINIWFKRRGEKITGAVVYNTDLFQERTIQRFAEHFINLLSDVSNSWHQPVSQIQILSPQEKKELIELNNDTQIHFDHSHTIHGLFASQASRSPDSIAAISGDSQITYKELSARSNQLADYLVKQGVTPGQMIGLCTERSIDMLVSLLGILKCGGCYIPLDPEFPAERLVYMVNDAGIGWLITQQEFSSLLPDVDNTILIDDLNGLIESSSADEVRVDLPEDSLAYIIYTSGSTGNPKGVMVPHNAVANFLLSMSNKPGIDASDKLLAVTTLSFDIAVLELYLPLISGATSIIASRQDAADGHRLLKLIRQQAATMLQATPSTWRLLIAAGLNQQDALKALCGGEALPDDLAQALLARTSSLWNMYGPTETTVWSSCCRISDDGQPLSIGTPIANTRFYLLDENLKLVPQGVSGELHISGAGVTKGYLNNSEMTASRFISNPFEAGSQLYKTGDRIRYRNDGSLQYLNRIDNQVKVRGYRIELGEIETVLRAHDSIKDCLVSVVEERKGDVRLVAYVVWQATPVTMTELRKYCKNWLPSYMIPQHTVEISAIPETPNGKVDRSQLPDVFCSLTHHDTYVAPDTETQIWLADLWKQLIHTDKVSKFDNFFELGGHSLLSMQVIHKVENKYGMILNPRDLLLESLEQIAQKLEKSTPDAPQKTSSRGLLGRIFNRN